MDPEVLVRTNSLNLKFDFGVSQVPLSLTQIFRLMIFNLIINLVSHQFSISDKLLLHTSIYLTAHLTPFTSDFNQQIRNSQVFRKSSNQVS